MTNRLFFAISLLLTLQKSLLGETPSTEPLVETHPLMPGIRMQELWDRNWPRPLHDRLAHFSIKAIYSQKGDTTFVCRDLWTGNIEWQLELPFAPSELTITVDIDGDGEIICPRPRKVVVLDAPNSDP